MNSQRAAVANGGENGVFSFFEALTFDSKEPSLNIRELGLPLSPPTLPVPGPHIPEENTSLQRTVTKSNGLPNPTKTTPSAKMATTKAQTQCLDLCHKTTTSIDLISVRILEYLTTAKQLPYGFEPLVHDFLDTCQILFSIEAGLGECNRSGQRLPQEMITELDHKFRVTQADFHILNQMLAKMLAPSNRLARSWGKLFGDTDIKKISTALAKTRESLRMSALVFQWSLGDEKIEKERGIGYTGLAAAMDRMDHKKGSGKSNETNDRMDHKKGSGKSNETNDNIPYQQPQTQTSSQVPQFPAPPPQPPSSFPFGAIDTQNVLQHHQQLPVPWSNRDSSIHHEGSIGRASGNEIRAPSSPGLRVPAPLSQEFRHNGATTTHHTTSTVSGIDSYERYDRHSAMDDTRSLTNVTEPDSFHISQHSNLTRQRSFASPLTRPPCRVCIPATPRKEIRQV
ncbi:hypothetical protein BDZ45DRAFT_165279 [Acephala macrosclerotiorum]|nr:hypothetical protein BDZ45DRAFT_165279 [Acephala macrosclerotiorum]